jgi:heme A synthase
MNADTIFQLSSGLAMFGWLLLILLSPFVFHIDKFLIGIIITLLCLVYAWLIVGYFKFSDMSNFGSLDGVMNLFTSRELVTAGWVHYLAFDLMVGIWIKRNSIKYNLPHLLIVPCLLLTFMLGPVGLLLYLLLRFGKTRRYFSENH